LALTGICLVVVLAMGREKPVPITESGSLLTTKLESESVDQAADPAVPVQRPPHATPPTIGEPPASPATQPTLSAAKTGVDAAAQIAAGTNRVPTPVEIQAAVQATPITMFSTSWCPTCARARVFLQTNGLRYTERDIDHDEVALQELRRRSGESKIPTFEIDGKMLAPGLNQTAFVNALVASIERRLGVTGIRVQFR